MPYQSFEELEVWRRSCQLAIDLTRSVAGSKNYTLKDQMTRAAVSIPSNIAEGCERDSKLDFIRFLRIAKGSAAELRTQIYIAEELELLSAAVAAKFLQELKEISAMLQGLIRSIARRATASD